MQVELTLVENKKSKELSLTAAIKKQEKHSEKQLQLSRWVFYDLIYDLLSDIISDWMIQAVFSLEAGYHQWQEIQHQAYPNDKFMDPHGKEDASLDSKVPKD